MKTIILFGLLLTSSCATVSEYNQGCRDGISFVVGENIVNHEMVNKECTDLDNVRKLEKKEYK
jgi:hypothetical protein